MGYKDLMEMLKSMPKAVGDNESNSLWPVYYGQYCLATDALLEVCERGTYVASEDVFLPLCFLAAHCIELWVKTILKNFGMGNLSEEDATAVLGHKTEELIGSLDSITYKNEEIPKKIHFVAALYKELNELIATNTDMSESMRYPVNKKDLPTLAEFFSEALEWQCFSVDLGDYIGIIRAIMHEMQDVYNLCFEEKLH